jgi:hypothetical protein
MEEKAEPTLSIVEEAKKIRDEIKAENDRREKILSDEQKLHAERLLTGTAGAPSNQTILTEEDIKKKEALEFWKGTTIAEAIAKNG